MKTERKRHYFYCNEDIRLIENYELAKADNFKGWDIHHRLETHDSNGNERLVDLSYEELVALGMYHNRPASELIFLRRKDHTKIHYKTWKGKKHSEETRKKMSEAQKGRLFSEETRRKMSKAQKGRQLSEETKKRMSESKKGKRYSEEHNKKISEARKGLKWFTNGVENRICLECPEGFTKGLTKHRSTI